MKEKNSALKIIGTVLLCISALYYTLFYLCESEYIGFVNDILYEDPFSYLFVSNNSGIMGSLLAFAVLAFAGGVSLAIAYSMNKRLIPVLIALAVLPIALSYVFGASDTFYLFSFVMLAVYVIGLVFVFIADRRFAPIFTILSLTNSSCFLGFFSVYTVAFRVTALICSVLSAATLVYAVCFAVNEKKIRQSKEAAA